MEGPGGEVGEEIREGMDSNVQTVPYESVVVNSRADGNSFET